MPTLSSLYRVFNLIVFISVNRKASDLLFLNCIQKNILLVLTQHMCTAYLYISCISLPQPKKWTVYLWKHVPLSTEKCIWSESELPGEQLKTQHFCAGEILTPWKCLYCASVQHSIWNLLCEQRAEESFGMVLKNIFCFFWGKSENIYMTLKISLLPSVGEEGGNVWNPYSDWSPSAAGT